MFKSDQIIITQCFIDISSMPAMAQQAPLTFTYIATDCWAAVNGTRAVRFRIYDLAGEALWSETHESVDVVDGLLTADVAQ